MAVFMTLVIVFRMVTKIRAAIFMLLIGLCPALNAQYVSPFGITGLSEMGGWSGEFTSRTDLIYSHSTPSGPSWNSGNYSSYPYGPLNPQLFSASVVAAPLAFDRGVPVFDQSPLTPNPSLDLATSQRQSLLFAGRQLIGTIYQHLHVPAFDPASVTSGFPWNPVTTNEFIQTSQDLHAGTTTTVLNPYKADYGMPTPGIDCTDFSAYIYNIALGVQMHSGTSNQITFPNAAPGSISGPAHAELLDSGGNALTPDFFYSPNFGGIGANAPGSLDGVLSQLLPGDLLYMKGGGGTISHVVVWLGEYGTNTDGSPSPVPLVISSHDNTPAIFSVNGTDQIDLITGLPTGLEPDGSNITTFLPPPGVQILPFTSDTWFYQNFSVAMQVIPVPEPSSFWLLLAAATVLSVILRGARNRAKVIA